MFFFFLTNSLVCNISGYVLMHFLLKYNTGMTCLLNHSICYMLSKEIRKNNMCFLILRVNSIISYWYILIYRYCLWTVTPTNFIWHLFWTLNHWSSLMRMLWWIFALVLWWRTSLTVTGWQEKKINKCTRDYKSG